MDEIRLAVRRLRKRPSTTLASIVTLALAIAAAAATWSIITAVLLKPLQVSDPERLVLVDVTYTGVPGGSRSTTSHWYPAYESVRDSGVFEQTAAGGTWPLMIGAGGAPPAVTPVYFATANFFDVLGVPVLHGRGFQPEDDRDGAPLVAVLSERFWRRVYGGDANAIGRTLLAGTQTATIVGVAVKGFRGLNLAAAPQVYLPLQTAGTLASPVNNLYARPGHTSSPTSWITIVSRLKPEMASAVAAARVNALLQPSGPAGSTTRYGVVDASTAALPATARAGVRQFARLLMGTVGLLVLIGCASVAMLLLMRTETRREEFATCLALGASKRRLAAGVAIEGGIAALIAAALSLPVTAWLFGALSTFQLPGGVNLELLELSVNVGVVTAAAAVALIATLIVGGLAAAFGFAGPVAELLRMRAGSTPPLSRRRTHRLLVSAQVAMALVLLGGAGLFARSLSNALELNPAFDTGRILTSTISLSSPGVTDERADQFFGELVQRLQANGSFLQIGTSIFGGSMGSGGTLTVDGEKKRFPSEVAFTAIDANYFAAVGLQLTAGRGFTTDDSANAPRVAIVSESYGRMISNGGTPLGLRITMPFNRIGRPADVLEVVGVVPDVVTNVNVLQPLAIYRPAAQAGPSTSRTLVVKAARDLETTRREIVATIRQMDPQLTHPLFLTLQERLWNQMGPQRFGAFVLGALGVLAALLTLGGTYVLAESLTIMRLREMGIRAALGASGRQLSGIVLRETASLVGIGLTGGLLLSWVGAETIRAFLYHVEPFDNVTLVTAAGLILLLALAVSVRPALRAARVDLASVLRAD